jgi:uncharacterized protein YndB with AHSA1/START domain
VTPTRHGPAVVQFPDERTIVLTRQFDAPIGLVFDVITRPEHVARWFFERELVECSIDLRVGGAYRYVYVDDDGRRMTFSGTYLEVERPTRTSETWRYDGWPDVHAVESNDLAEAAGVTILTVTLAFADDAGRAKMTRYDGLHDSLGRMADLLRELQASSST